MEKRDPGLEARLKEAFKGCCSPLRSRSFATAKQGFGGAIHAFASCDSTMERAHALAREGAGEGTLVFASRQTQGRGRLGRKWESPEGGAYFSLILRPSRPLSETPQLSLVAGLAAAEAIHEQLTSRLSDSSAARQPVSIRWPNDLLLDGKKVAGILTEASTHHSSLITHHYVVVGIGINVTTDPRDLPDTATSLAEKVPGTFEKSAWHLFPLVAALCSNFDSWYDIWTAKGFAPIRQALHPWMSHMGGLVRLTTGVSHMEGQAMDVDEHGRLLVRLDSGIVRAFEAGEVTPLH